MKPTELLYVRLTRGCHLGFDGALAGVSFRNGISAKPMQLRKAKRFSTGFGLEDLGGTQIRPIGPFAGYVSADDSGNPHESEAAPKTKKPKAKAKVESVKAEAPVVSPELWTKEELEKIADKGGIGELREISDPLGVRGTSITGIIEKVVGLAK